MPSKGFTLIEIVVAVALFSILLGVVTSLLFVALSSQRQSITIQELVSQSSTVAEYMTRAIRQAQKETDQECLPSEGLNYEITHSGSGVKFVNAQNQCQEFFLESQRLKEVKGAQTTFLSPDDVQIISLNFFARGESQADALQPRLSFFIDMQGKNDKPGTKTRFQLQSTISQRAYDIVQ